ncbi:hypothetical protein [Xanthomonas arboricola]|uniref:hypothetical protein n=1 Tax=Xanthomonas arboricola TaxID=56448 RepID=UPI002DD648D1|nr:hypothetical protein [Xanthomonas arboricola]
MIDDQAFADQAMQRKAYRRGADLELGSQRCRIDALTGSIPAGLQGAPDLRIGDGSFGADPMHGELLV